MGKARSAGRTLAFSAVPMLQELNVRPLHSFPQGCVFSREQSLYRLTKLPTDFQQDFRRNFLFVSPRCDQEVRISWTSYIYGYKQFAPRGSDARDGVVCITAMIALLELQSLQLRVFSGRTDPMKSHLSRRKSKEFSDSGLRSKRASRTGKELGADDLCDFGTR
jgi:hypothetical protein